MATVTALETSQLPRAPRPASVSLQAVRSFPGEKRLPTQREPAHLDVHVEAAEEGTNRQRTR
jgi:hypothetical protein